MWPDCCNSFSSGAPPGCGCLLPVSSLGPAFADDGATPAELAARLAAAKKRVEEEKMAEWQAQRAAGKKGD